MVLSECQTLLLNIENVYYSIVSASKNTKYNNLKALQYLYIKDDMFSSSITRSPFLKTKFWESAFILFELGIDGINFYETKYYY